jgi:hypothetical protein
VARTGTEGCVGSGGLIFYGLACLLIVFVKQEPALAMTSLFVTRGIFLLFASCNHQRIGA